MDHIGELADRLRSPSAPLRVVSGVAVAVPDASHVLVSVGDRVVTAWSPGSVLVGDNVRLLVGGNVCEVVSSRSPLSQWTAPTLAGSWVRYGDGALGPAYRRVGDEVHVRGVVKSGSGTILTLPVGYRPVGICIYTVTAAAGVARIQVGTDGAVTVALYAAGGSNALVSLDGIRFSTT